MIGGTSGSETKLCQPSASQSKSTQTRSASLGSRKTVAPLDPCCLRFSAPLVEKIFSKRSVLDLRRFQVHLLLLLLLFSAPGVNTDGAASACCCRIVLSIDVPAPNDLVTRRRRRVNPT